MQLQSTAGLSRRKNIIIAIAYIIITTILFRFANLQLIEHKTFVTKSGNNSIRKIPLVAPRGIVYDRSNNPLVDNQPVYDLSVIPYDVSEKFNYSLLSSIIKISENELENSISIMKQSFNRFRPNILKRHVDFETRSILEENKLEFSGMIFSENPARTYPSDANLTHTLGYLRTVTEQEMKNHPEKKYRLGDVSGFSGLEKIYEDTLRGIDGVEFRLVDIFGVDHGLHPDSRAYPLVPGNSLTITIDESLQIYAESKMDTLKGAIICTNPKTGEVLTFVSAPDYDLSPFVGPIPHNIWNGWNNDTDKPLLNRVIQGVYPPASPFKLIATALALENNIIDPYEKINCSGSFILGGRPFHCWNIYGHGDLNMKEAIKHSCNVYFYTLIQKMKFKDWAKIVESFGFGSKTGIDLPNEKSGLVPNKEYMNKKYGRYGWATGNLLTFVIGQGDVLATPVQVVNMMNIIATRGNTFQPHFKKDGLVKPISLSFKNRTWNFLQDATWQVVNGKNGTGKGALIDDGVVRGKTGTGQNPHGEDHSWFTGYVTSKGGHQMSIAVIIENGGKGSGIATSISRDLFAYFVNQIEGTHD